MDAQPACNAKKVGDMDGRGEECFSAKRERATDWMGVMPKPRPILSGSIR